MRYLSKQNALERYLFYKQQQKVIKDYKQGFSYGLKSGKSPPQVKDLILFEDDPVRIVKELKFCKVKNDFQKILGEDMKKV